MIPMTGLYAEGQLDHVRAGIAKLKGKCSTVIVYTRPGIAHLLDSVQSEAGYAGIELIPGLSLHGGSGANMHEIYDYVLDKYCTTTEAYQADASERDRRLVGAMSSTMLALQNRYGIPDNPPPFVLVSEPCPVQLGYVHRYFSPLLPATSVWCSPWLDQPTCQRDEIGIVDISLMLFIARQNPRAVFLPLEPFSTGDWPHPADWRGRFVELMDRAGLTWHPRLCVASVAEPSFPWTPDTVPPTREFVARGYRPPVLYVKHEDWVDVCEYLP